jgi:hypothetical protein
MRPMRDVIAAAVVRVLGSPARLTHMQVERFNLRLADWFTRYGNVVMAGNLVVLLGLREYMAGVSGPLSAAWILYYGFATGFFLVAWYSFVTSVLRYRRQKHERHVIRSAIVGRAFIDPQGDRGGRYERGETGLNPARKWTAGPR